MTPTMTLKSITRGAAGYATKAHVIYTLADGREFSHLFQNAGGVNLALPPAAAIVALPDAPVHQPLPATPTHLALPATLADDASDADKAAYQSALASATAANAAMDAKYQSDLATVESANAALDATYASQVESVNATNAAAHAQYDAAKQVLDDAIEAADRGEIAAGI